MRDLVDEITAAHRDVRRRGAGEAEEVAVTISRRCPAVVGDVCNAVTDPERLRRWFAPVTGDLRVGGSFQVEGNAGGEVQAGMGPRRPGPRAVPPGEEVEDPAAWQSTPEVQRAAAASIAAWTDAIAASGTAGSDEIAAAGEMARAGSPRICRPRTGVPPAERLSHQSAPPDGVWLTGG